MDISIQFNYTMCIQDNNDTALGNTVKWGFILDVVYG